MRLMLCATMCLLCACLVPVDAGGLLQGTQVKSVNVTSKQARPNLFLVIDKSGSMNFSADPSPGCQTMCGNSACGNNGCKTRIGELKASFSRFLASAGATAHFGMVPYPNAATSACGAAALGDVGTTGVDLDVSGPDDDASLAALASSVNIRIQALTPSGGTPTGPTLHALKDYAPLTSNARSNYVVLVTDGLPNCSTELDSQATTCECTFVKPAGQACTVAGFNQCLDRDGTAANVAILRDRGIKTIVVGFGAELAAAASGMPLASTLGAIAQAGGFQRRCSTNADCGVDDTCSVSAVDPCGKVATVCARSYFLAQNADELTRALTDISDSTRCADPCTQILPSRPSGATAAARAAQVAVFLDGVEVPAGATTWAWDDAAVAVVFAAGTQQCNSLLNASAARPVKLEIRFVQAP